MISPTDIGWIAGILDGEGTITLIKPSGAGRFRQPAVSAVSTDPEIVTRLKTLIGGRIYKRPRYVNRKQAWGWRMAGRAVLDLLQLVEPYLSCPAKRTRARLLLGEYDRVTAKNGQYSDEGRAAKMAFEAQFFQFFQLAPNRPSTSIS